MLSSSLALFLLNSIFLSSYSTSISKFSLLSLLILPLLLNSHTSSIFSHSFYINWYQSLVSHPFRCSNSLLLEKHFLRLIFELFTSLFKKTWDRETWRVTSFNVSLNMRHEKDKGSSSSLHFYLLLILLFTCSVKSGTRASMFMKVRRKKLVLLMLHLELKRMMAMIVKMIMMLKWWAKFDVIQKLFSSNNYFVFFIYFKLQV